MTEVSKEKSKKILQLCAIDFTVENLLSPLIEKLMEHGYTVHVACADTGRMPELMSKGYHMINIHIERRIRPISNLKTILQLFSLMKKEHYDIVHVHTPVAAVLGRIAAKLAGVRNIVYTAHGFYFHEGMSKFQYCFFYLLEKYMARFCTDWLLLQSHEDYILCKRASFKKESRIIHISNGVDIHRKFNPDRYGEDIKEKYRNELGISIHDTVITFVGRLVSEKGIFELIEAFKTLNEEYPNLKLLLIGEINPSERDQEGYIKLKDSIENTPSIVSVGYRRDIPELLSISDVFVLPSHREGLPRSIIEAMAMKLPVVATNIRGCREEVHHGENGYLVEKKNTKELYLRLKSLVENKKLRKKFGEKGRMMAEDMFDENKILEMQLQLFGSFL